jgi:hypothetical protein
MPSMYLRTKIASVLRAERWEEEGGGGAALFAPVVEYVHPLTLGDDGDGPAIFVRAHATAHKSGSGVAQY